MNRVAHLQAVNSMLLLPTNACDWNAVTLVAIEILLAGALRKVAGLRPLCACECDASGQLEIRPPLVARTLPIGRRSAIMHSRSPPQNCLIQDTMRRT
jgi:hypothetical protein